MAEYTKGMLVFGLGVLIVSLWCMTGTEASGDGDDGPTIHAVKREDPSEGCGSHHSEGGVEECTDEDDSLGLYGDIDDTFKGAVRKVASSFHHHHDGDDSPDVAHNNVNVVGH